LIDPIPYYEIRLAEFNSRIASAKSHTHRELLNHALEKTHEVGKTFYDLCQQFTRFSPLAKQVIGEAFLKNQDIFKSASELMANLEKFQDDKTLDPEIKRSTALITYHALLTSGDTAKLQLATADAFVQSFQMVVPILVDTLALKLLRPDDSKFNLEAIHSGIEFAIGFIPIVGDAASALLAIRSILSNRTTRLKKIDDYFQYLEQYISASEGWCKGAREAITLNSGLIEAYGGGPASPS
jgi:hypothetical protein